MNIQYPAVPAQDSVWLQKQSLASKWLGRPLADVEEAAELLTSPLQERLRTALGTAIDQIPPPNCMGTALFLAGVIARDQFVAPRDSADLYFSGLEVSEQPFSGALVAWEDRTYSGLGGARFVHAALLIDVERGALLQRRFERSGIFLDQCASSALIYPAEYYRMVSFVPRPILEEELSRATVLFRRSWGAPWEG